MAISKNVILNMNYCLTHSYLEIPSSIKPSIEDVISMPLEIPNAYVKIVSLEGSKDKVVLNVGIHTASRELISIDTHKFTPDVSYNSDNFIKQGYEYLKTLPEYTDAIDVLEDGQML